jgi:CoA:oxalate CoA-transferase
LQIPETAGPLAGTKVLDLSRMVSGPLCGRMLADLGADVIKIEPPDGDPTRRVPPLVNGLSPYFAQMNAGKRNLSIDLKTEEGPALVARLAADADVLIENFRPGVMARHGLDATSLRRRGPRLIYCSVTGWGQEGPWKHRRAYAPLVHAEVGSMDWAARHRQRRPEYDANQHADVYTAVLATSAVLAALLERSRSGEGQHIDLAMGQAALYVNEWAAVNLQDPTDEFGGFDTWNHFTYVLGDGSYVALVGNPVDLFPVWFPRLGGSEGVLTEPRFSTREARAKHVGEVVAAIEELTAQFDNFAALEAVLDEWMLAAHVRSASDLAATEWSHGRRLTVEVAPGLSIPAAPWATSGGEVVAKARVAHLGADNLEILRSVGLSVADIGRLQEARVICSHEEAAEPTEVPVR